MKEDKTTQSVCARGWLNLAGFSQYGGGILLGLLNILSRWIGLLRETMFLIFLGKGTLDTITLALSVSNTTKKIAAEGFMEHLIIPGLSKFEDHDDSKQKWLNNMLSFVIYLTFGIASIVCALSPIIGRRINTQEAVPGNVLLDAFCVESAAICLYMLGNFATAILYKANRLSWIGLGHLIPSITQCFLLIGFYKYIGIRAIFIIILTGVLQSVSFCYAGLKIYSNAQNFSIFKFLFSIMSIISFSVSSILTSVCIFTKLRYGDLFAIISEESCAMCGKWFAGLLILQIASIFIMLVWENINRIIGFRPKLSSIIFVSVMIPFFLQHMSFINKELNAIFAVVGMFFGVIYGVIQLLTRDFKSFPFVMVINQLLQLRKLVIFSILGLASVLIILIGQSSILIACMVIYMLIFLINRAAGSLFEILYSKDEKISQVTQACLSSAPDVFIGSSVSFIGSLVSNIIMYNFLQNSCMYMVSRNEKILHSVYVFFHSISFLVISDMPDQIANKKYDVAQRNYNTTVWIIMVLLATMSGILFKVSNKMFDFLKIFSGKNVETIIDPIYITSFKIEMLILPALCIKAVLCKAYFAHSMPKFVSQSRLIITIIQIFLRCICLIITQNFIVVTMIGIVVHYIELIYLFSKSCHLKINAYYPFIFWKKWFFPKYVKVSSNMN